MTEKLYSQVCFLYRERADGNCQLPPLHNEYIFQKGSVSTILALQNTFDSCNGPENKGSVGLYLGETAQGQNYIPRFWPTPHPTKNTSIILAHLLRLCQFSAAFLDWNHNFSLVHTFVLHIWEQKNLGLVGLERSAGLLKKVFNCWISMNSTN